MNERSRLAIITPIFLGSGTGAAIYYRLLVKALCDRNYVCSVISEHTTEPIPAFVAQYWDVFPTRTGKNKQILRDLFIYALQNLGYLQLLSIVRREQPRIVVIHSSFYNLPGIFSPIIKYLMRSRPKQQRWFIDVRDVLLPIQQMHHLLAYDGIIACSENVGQRLIHNGIPQQRVTQIPILQEPLQVDPQTAQAAIAHLGLSDQKYVLYVGMIKEIKAVDLLLEAFTSLVYPQQPDTILVVAGYLKTGNPRMAELLCAPGVRYVGNQTREVVQCLMWGAQLCVNLSPNEALSRSSLEALALKRPALLPPNIPEFERYCPEFVVQTRDPQAVAERIIQALEQPVVPNYPIEHHYPEAVVAQYEQLFQST